MLAKFLFAVVLDDPKKADTQVHEIDALGPVAPIDDLVDDFRREFGCFPQAFQVDRHVGFGGRPGRNRKHHEIGAPGDALCVGLESGDILPGDDAGHRGAVGELGPAFVDRAEEEALDDVRVQELGV